MLRVAYVLPALLRPSGWRTYAIALLRSIQEYVEPVIFASAADAEEARSLFPQKQVFVLPVTQSAALTSLRGQLALLRCYRAISSNAFPKVDQVHSLEAYPTGLVGSWLSRRLGCPHALTAHGTYGVVWHDLFLDRLAYRRVLRHASLVLSVSQGTETMLRRYFGSDLAGARLRVILNGNDFTKRVPQQQALERSWPEVPTMLSVGDIKPRKGQHHSLAAFALVKKDLPQARYWIVGKYQNNEYYLNMQRYVAENDLKDVSFLGTVSDDELDRLYRLASLFVLTPQQEGLSFEGFGLVYLEAGAYGLPVVATRSGGVADAVKDGHTGLLVEPGDVEGIAVALLRLLTNPDLLRRMGRENRLWAESLTWERNAAEHYQAYQEVCQ